MRPFEGLSTAKVTKFTSELKQRLSDEYFRSLQYNTNNILNGTCLIFDPSSGGVNSLPAYAVIHKGKIEDLQEIHIPDYYRKNSSYIAHRLRFIGKHLTSEFSNVRIDLLVMELLYHTPQENTVMKSFQSLTMAMGAIHASVDAQYRMMLPPWEWHKRRDSTYVKGDLEDVMLMVRTLIEDSNTILGGNNAASQKV